jgi:hypothetical protein
MAAAKGLRLAQLSAALLAALLLWGAGASALAHRMPEVQITAERAELGGRAVTAMTFRLTAADALVLLGREREIATDLSDPAILKEAGEKALEAIATEGGPVSYLGGELDENYVYLFAAGPEGLELTDARVLASVYDAWTNIYRDERQEGLPTRMFTQWGEQGSQSGHRHGHHH